VEFLVTGRELCHQLPGGLLRVIYFTEEPDLATAASFGDRDCIAEF
jgi:hypothetical protein